MVLQTKKLKKKAVKKCLKGSKVKTVKVDLGKRRRTMEVFCS